MKLIWTMDAAGDFEAIIDMFRSKVLTAGQRLVKHIFETISKLPLIPLRGQAERRLWA